jgi:excisionase family DNA binding protein
MQTTTEVFLQTFLTAPKDLKKKALMVLRGESPKLNPAEGQSSVPLVMGMAAAARHLGVSRPTLWRMVRAGRLRKLEIYPGAFRVSRADVDAIAKTYERRGKKHA